jgi:hypothetical protein
MFIKDTNFILNIIKANGIISSDHLLMYLAGKMKFNIRIIRALGI